MIVTSPSKRDAGVARAQSLAFVTDGTLITVRLGFNPINLELLNATDVILYKKIAGMNAPDCIKQIAAGTTTVDTTSQILINGDGTVTIAVASAPAGKAFTLFAQ